MTREEIKEVLEDFAKTHEGYAEDDSFRFGDTVVHFQRTCLSISTLGFYGVSAFFEYAHISRMRVNEDTLFISTWLSGSTFATITAKAREEQD